MRHNRKSNIRVVMAGVLACLPNGHGAIGSPITIDLTGARYTISPYIYGKNTYPGYKTLPDATVWRMGGNSYSPYNWVTNATNSGTDWSAPGGSTYFLIDKPEFRDVPAGVIQQYIGRGPEFSNNVSMLVTIPFAGYVAADANGHVTAAEAAPSLRFKPMLAAKPGAPASLTATPNPNADAVYADEYVYALKKRYGADVFSRPERRIMFELDNEVDNWQAKHPLIHPKPATYAEINGKSVEWAKAIKAVAPEALVFSPAGLGPLTMQSLGSAPDAPPKDKQVKNDYFISWLKAAKAAEDSQGYRVLDGFSFHWYSFGVDLDKTRVQAPRSLWDPTYTEHSWVSQWFSIWPADGKEHPLVTLPLMKQEIRDYCPGTKLAITEYDYGGDKDVTGALAEADFLGVIGREGIFLANHWGDSNHFTRAGLQIYRNYNGKGGTFGDIGLPVDGVDPNDASVYASLDTKTPGKLTVVAINKTAVPMPISFALKGAGLYRTATVYHVTQSSDTVEPAGSAVIQGKSILLTLPASSVSLIDVRR